MQSERIYQNIAKAVAGEQVVDVLTAIGMLASQVFTSEHIGTYEERRDCAVSWCRTVLETVSEVGRAQRRTH